VSLFCVNLLNGGGIAESPSACRGSGVGGAGDFGLNAGCRGGRVKLRGTERVVLTMLGLHVTRL
jgi:hypothetical protein